MEEKISHFKYAGMELIKLLIPIFLTFLTAYFFSKMFSSKELFETYILSKVHVNLTNEMFSIFYAITTLIGIIFIFKKLFEFDVLDNILDLILEEIPKSIRVFNGAITGSIYALAWYSYSYNFPLDQTPFKLFLLGTVFAIIFFLYSFTLQYLIDRKKIRDNQRE